MISKSKVKSKKSKLYGFTIVELLVAMTLFVILITIAAGGFVRAIRTQQAIVSLIDANNNASLALEQMAREMRTGTSFVGIGPGEIQFVNAYGQIIHYRLNAGVIEKGTDNGFGSVVYNSITAGTVKVSNLSFTLLDATTNPGYPPRVTIAFTISTTNAYLQGVSTNIQTTVSARNI